MKRFFTLALAIIMMFTITLSANAANFVNSITNKGAPQLVVIDNVDGKDVVGYITDTEGKQLSKEFVDCFHITSVADAETDTVISEDAKKMLIDAYEELNKADTKLSEVCPELNNIVKEKWDADKTADDLVVKDLFDVSDYCDDIKNHLNNDAVLDLTFDVGIAAGSFIAAMVYVDGKWQPVVDCINNGDGTVTVKFDKLCPVAFLVPGTGASTSTVSPTTSDASGVILWSVVMVLSLGAIAALVIFRRKVNG